MNKKYLLLVPLMIGLVIAGSVPVGAISDEQKVAISQNCSSMKDSLKRLQKADSRTRVFLGASYEHLLSNFMAPLNVRLAKNNRPNTTLSDIQTQFATKRNKFSESFTSYMKTMEALVATDCWHDADSFYNRLTTVRSQRTELNQLSKDLRELTNQNILTVNKLKDSL